LNFVVYNSLRNIVRDWIGAESRSPDGRIIEKARIGLIVRGLLDPEDKAAAESLKNAATETMQTTVALLRQYETGQPELADAIKTSIHAASNDLLHVTKGQNDNFSEKSAWEAEINPVQYNTIRGAQKMNPLAVWAFFIVVGLLAVLLGLSGIINPFLFAGSIVAGIAIQFSQLRMGLPFAAARRRQAEFLAGIYEPVAKKQYMDSFADAGRNPFVYYGRAILITGNLFFIPVYVYAADHGVVAVILAFAIYGGFLSAYRRQQSKLNKARNKSYLADALSELEKNTVAGPMVSRRWGNDNSGYRKTFYCSAAQCERPGWFFR
jgi:hypothetical protein